MKLLLTIIFLLALALLGWQLTILIHEAMVSAVQDGRGFGLGFVLVLTLLAASLTVNHYLANDKE